ncbi:MULTISPECIES: LysR family transcriptional regulator [unclassified Beijerinckia]|uniref:LysR family transcriptional regulator n=1 Tax=unclassified Beijerinckia TaxID=2638183 RepID=UPI0008987618|nr:MULTISPECIES: LysR family transcriptional regulator [unclassified Beijerinckia]MDH7798328.1 DNA-binding transcriptional LysR family regulator [Beijerinckia sp. GAS462]SED17267.1 DNA-binding transcriptional regulator, LysR family [Beijerinckia sp. 28-YEA-48]
MDVRQLRQFATVAETLHFGRAAARLGMTQPPLSQSIQALERELGTPLFVRTKRSVALTPFGEQWLIPVRAALEGVNALPDIAKRLRDGETGRLELSFVSTADYSILPTLVRRYASLYPDVEIALTEATSDVQITALLEGRGHAGLIIPPADGTLPEQLGYHRLVSEPLVAAVPDSWIDEGRLPLTNNQLAPDAVVHAPLVIFPRQSAPSFYDLVTGYFTAHGRPATIVQKAIQMQTIISLVSAGMGIALVPASLRHLARTGVRYIDLMVEPPTLETGIAWRTDDMTPTLRRFLATVIDDPTGLVSQPVGS